MFSSPKWYDPTRSARFYTAKTQGRQKQIGFEWTPAEQIATRTVA